MQEFFINQNATLPLLKMELINDGRTDFNKFYELIQSATITFSMTNTETGVIKVSNQPVYLLPKEDSCGDEYYLTYKWNQRDTKVIGKYSGKFNIAFNNSYGGGNLIVPIQDELIIYVK